MPLGPLWIDVLDEVVRVALIAVLAYHRYTEVVDRGERSVTDQPEAA